MTELVIVDRVAVLSCRRVDGDQPRAAVAALAQLGTAASVQRQVPEDDAARPVVVLMSVCSAVFPAMPVGPVEHSVM